MIHHYDGYRQCDHCRSDWTQFCDEGPIVFGGLNGHGAHAEYMTIPAHSVLKLHDGMSFRSGAAVACGSGTAYAALKRVDLAGDETVAVWGRGPVGLSATLSAKAMGARHCARRGRGAAGHGQGLRRRHRHRPVEGGSGGRDPRRDARRSGQGHRMQR
jgi:D-arabinose 1-dehydrogenase-like Zn-dependent alcohol dehydrogenase